jgi:hypothetical protein
MAWSDFASKALDLVAGAIPDILDGRYRWRCRKAVRRLDMLKFVPMGLLGPLQRLERGEGDQDDLREIERFLGASEKWVKVEVSALEHDKSTFLVFEGSSLKHESFQVTWRTLSPGTYLRAVAYGMNTHRFTPFVRRRRSGQRLDCVNRIG